MKSNTFHFHLRKQHQLQINMRRDNKRGAINVQASLANDCETVSMSKLSDKPRLCEEIQAVGKYSQDLQGVLQDLTKDLVPIESFKVNMRF